LVQALTPSHIVVDLVDDQRLFPGNEGQRTVITEQYQQFIELGHRVMSNSPGLVETLGAEFGRTLEHLPNALLPMLPLDTPTVAWPPSTRPVVGYVGNLRGRIDIDTLLHVMQRHPQWDFWFVGQTHRSRFYAAAKGLPNARFLGTLGYAQAQGVMAQFDVAIVPFVADALVKSMSPIKLDDYARLALPTVVLDPQNKKGFEQALLEALKGQ
jgi:glycosyltransferase involved in cell wall biosynthesis